MFPASERMFMIAMIRPQVTMKQVSRNSSVLRRVLAYFYSIVCGPARNRNRAITRAITMFVFERSSEKIGGWQIAAGPMVTQKILRFGPFRVQYGSHCSHR